MEGGLSPCPSLLKARSFVQTNCSLELERLSMHAVTIYDVVLQPGKDHVICSCARKVMGAIVMHTLLCRARKCTESGYISSSHIRLIRCLAVIGQASFTREHLV